MIDQQLKDNLLGEIRSRSSSWWLNSMLSSIDRGDPNDIMSNCVLYNAPHVLQLVLPHTHCRQEDYYKQLNNAVSDGHIQCAALLWDKAVPSPQQGYNLLQEAMLKKHVNVAHWILQKDVDLVERGHVLLALSACQGCEPLAEELLKWCDYTASLHLLRDGFMHEYPKWQWFEELMLARQQRAVLEKVVPILSTTSVRKM